MGLSVVRGIEVVVRVPVIVAVGLFEYDIACLASTPLQCTRHVAVHATRREAPHLGRGLRGALVSAEARFAILRRVGHRGGYVG